MAAQSRTRQMVCAINRIFAPGELLELRSRGASHRALAQMASERLGRPVSHYYIQQALKRLGINTTARHLAELRTLLHGSKGITDSASVSPSRVRAIASQ
jgi:hypothetical protein